MKHKYLFHFVSGLAIFCSFLFIGLIARSQALQTKQTHSALCALRADLVVRVRSSREFLQAHPHGIPGISAATIHNGIDNQQRTIDALDILKCSDAENRPPPAN